jgi:hypothetical protein
MVVPLATVVVDEATIRFALLGLTCALTGLIAVAVRSRRESSVRRLPRTRAPESL